MQSSSTNAASLRKHHDPASHRPSKSSFHTRSPALPAARACFLQCAPLAQQKPAYKPLEVQLVSRQTLVHRHLALHHTAQKPSMLLAGECWACIPEVSQAAGRLWLPPIGFAAQQDVSEIVQP